VSVLQTIQANELSSSAPLTVSRAGAGAGYKSTLLALPLCLAVLDAWLSYFLTRAGVPMRVGFLALAALGLCAVLRGPAVFSLRTKYAVPLYGLAVSMLLGVVLVDELGTQRVFQAVGVPVYFLCGYVFFRWTTDVGFTARILFVLGILYVTVCVLAVSRIAPAFFPVIDKFVLQPNGQLLARPEVMTDQNFQMFYFVPVLVGFLMARSKVGLLLFGGLLIGAAYVLAQLGTRSGTLVLVGATSLGLMMAWRNPSLGKYKVFILPVAAIAIGLLFWTVILEQASLLFFRFRETGFEAAGGRLYSTIYLFGKVVNPAWWLPRGVSEFRLLTGSLPHSNVTAVFLDGGIIGLICWVSLVLVPAVKLASRAVFGGRLDAIAAAVACSSVAMLVLQFSLYAITTSQVWIWAGATIGVLSRLDSARRSAARRKPGREM